MNWFIIIIFTISVLIAIGLFILNLDQQNLFFQALCVFIFDHKDWKRYRRLKQYLKTNTIPIINITDYKGNNAGFAFIQYDNLIFIIQGDDIYLSSYHNHLINDLLKRNNHDS